MAITLAVHGGAWNIPDEDAAATREGLRQALECGWQALREGGWALDVVELVVRMLEDDPHFNAGRGSRLDREGKVRMDASIMEGSRLDAGAVGAIQRVRHPVSVARRVMTDSPHVMLVGEGAREFAEEVRAELCLTGDLLVGRERERFLRASAGERDLVDEEFGSRRADPADAELGTVGAVALDQQGRVAAATSTGGTQDRLPGRVGDTPVIGAGTYADDRAGAASATGWGEGILRVVLCKSAVDLLLAGRSPEQAGREALAALDRVHGLGGLILVDTTGRVAAVFNTPRMARGWATEHEAPRVEIESPHERP
jgi:beta-aspartyl-peptidase (threonine type)